MFEKINLYTRGGDLVVEVMLLTMSVPPEILVWGDRHFVRVDGKYLEGFAYAPMDRGMYEARGFTWDSGADGGAFKI